MKKIFVLGCMLAGAFTVSAQQSSLLEKYRNMALEYNHDLKAAEGFTDYGTAYAQLARKIPFRRQLMPRFVIPTQNGLGNLIDYFTGQPGLFDWL